MTLLKLQRVLACLVVMLAVNSGCSSVAVPTAVPPTATLDAAPEDNPTAGAIVRSTRQAQATATRQVQLVEEATQVALQATQTAAAHAAATATIVAARLITLASAAMSEMVQTVRNLPTMISCGVTGAHISVCIVPRSFSPAVMSMAG